MTRISATITLGIFLCSALTAEALVSKPRLSSPVTGAPKFATPHLAAGLLTQPSGTIQDATVLCPPAPCLRLTQAKI